MKSSYSKEDISEALRSIDIRENDNVFIHSNIGYFGVLAQANNVNDYADYFIDSIFEVIGKKGTLIVPTFSYSFCRGESYDMIRTPGVCGLLSEAVRTDPRAARSDDANFSVAAIGWLADYFTKDAPEYSFGRNSFWNRFLNSSGKIANFNFDAGSTFIHYVEKSLNVPYRYDKGFKGVSIEGSESIQKIFYHFVYDLNKPQNAPNFTKFHEKSIQTGIARKTNLGRGQIIMVTAQDTFELIKKELKEDPCFLTKEPTIQ